MGKGIYMGEGKGAGLNGLPFVKGDGVVGKGGNAIPQNL